MNWIERLIKRPKKKNINVIFPKVRRGFDIVDKASRNNDWRPANLTADGDISRAITAVRTYARDLVNNNDYAKRYINLCVTNIVGADGFVFQSKVKNEDDTFNDVINEQIENIYSEFCKPVNCTITGKLSFKQVQSLIVKHWKRDGECFIRLLRGNYNKLGFTLQIIEPDYIDEKYSTILENGNAVIMGIEKDSYGKVMAYYVKNIPSNYQYTNYNISTNHTRIPAEEIIHIYDIDRADQTRGISSLVQSMTRLRHLSGYEEAYIINARVSASKMGFIESVSDNYQGSGTDESGNTIVDIEPGVIEQLPPNTKFTSFDPKYPETAHSMFIKSTLRGVASGLGVSYNLLANDLEGVNYSSIRAGLLDEREMWKDGQANFITTVLDRVICEVIKMAVIKGLLKINFTEIEKYIRPYWIGRRWAWVDPRNDIDANIASVKAGFKTATQVIAEQGGDIQEVYEQLSFEKMLAEKYDLELSINESENKEQEINKENIEDEISEGVPDTATGEGITEPGEPDNTIIVQ